MIAPGKNRGFHADLNRYAKTEERRGPLVFQAIAAGVSDNVKSGGKYGPGTPVDTGYARNSWADGVNAVASAPPDTSNAIESLVLGDTYFLTSNAEYMRALDEGHSQQAPNGHVRLVMAALDQIAADAVREVTP